MSGLIKKTVEDDKDDAWMIRVYTKENATQRGNTGAAQAGAIASAVKYLARGILTDADALQKNFSMEHVYLTCVICKHVG